MESGRSRPREKERKLEFCRQFGGWGEGQKGTKASGGKINRGGYSCSLLASRRTTGSGPLLAGYNGNSEQKRLARSFVSFCVRAELGSGQSLAKEGALALCVDPLCYRLMGESV